MKKELNIEEAAKQIFDDPAPVLLIDTCAALDVIRAPVRKDIQTNVISAAIKIANASTSKPRRLWIVALSLVCSELYDNIPNTEAELEKFIIDTNDQISMLNDASLLLGDYTPIPLYRIQHFDLPENLTGIMRDIFKEAVILKISDTYRITANSRVVQCKPPARKGGQLKDCLIFEHYLALCRQLRKIKFDKLCVFTSSNTKDYYKDGSLAPSLKAELEQVELEFTTDLAWAESLIKNSK